MCRFWITIGHDSVKDLDSLILKKKLDGLYLDAGPDYQNIHKTNTCIAYHSRLAIQDLSSSSNPPITNDEGDIFVFNGEIFNWPELVKSFPRELFSTFPKSDSQFLFSILVNNHFEKISKKLRGFFSFVFYSPKNKLLSYSRDYLGIKPLYFSIIENKFPIFASTAESILLHPRINQSIDKTSLKNFINYGFFPGDNSIYAGIKQVEPGAYTSIRLNDDFSLSDQKQTIRFNLNTVLEDSSINLGVNDFSPEQFTKVLKDSCHSRLLSDVPTALLLSGGIDSNLLAWAYSELLDTKLPCFTLAFDKYDVNDEFRIASQTCSELNLEHHILNFDDYDLSRKILRIFSKLDQPFVDTSLIPTTLICEEVSKQYKVAISADGGDEVFGGYTKYKYNEKYFKFLSFLKNFPEAIFDYSNKFIRSHKYGKLMDILKDKEYSNKSIYFHQHRLWNNQLIKKIFKEDNDFDEYKIFNKYKKFACDGITELQLLDLSFYMKDNILYKIDRASMSTGLELREPLLDQSVLKYGLQLKKKYKISNNLGKKCLRDFISDKLPHVHDLSKKGFGIPLSKLCQILDNNFNEILYDSSSSSIWSIFDKEFLINLLKSNKINKTQEWQLKTLLIWCKSKGL